MAGHVNLVVTLTIEPFIVVTVLAEPKVIVPPTVCAHPIVTSPTSNAAPITMFPLVADGPMDNEVFPLPASTQSIIGVVNFVVALTDVPFKVVTVLVEPILMIFALAVPVPILISPVAVLALPVPILINPLSCVPPMVREPPTRFPPTVIAVAASDESTTGDVNLVVTLTVEPFNVVTVLAEPKVIVPPTVCAPPIVTSPTSNAAPITMFPLIADGPIDNDVNPALASDTQSIIGVVNFVA